MELICVRLLRNKHLYSLQAYRSYWQQHFGTFIHQHKACILQKTKAPSLGYLHGTSGSLSQPFQQQLRTDAVCQQQRRTVCLTQLTPCPGARSRLLAVRTPHQSAAPLFVPVTPCIRTFHTSGPLRALPAPLVWLVLKPLQKLLAIILGRTIRKWWVALPANRQELLRQAAWRRRWHLAAGGVALMMLLSLFFLTHLDESPVTGRTRLLVVSQENFAELAKLISEGYMEEFKDSLVSPEDPRHKVVETVVKHLAQRNLDIEEVAGTSWSVHVVDSPTINAFVLPNGKVFVFTGMLEAVADIHQLTFVLAHEMAHALIGHGAEEASMSHVVDFLSLILLAAIWAVCPGDSVAVLGQWIQGKLVEFMFSRPYSRKLEAEADQVGLQLAAKACADVRAGPVFWQQMEISDQLSGEPTVPEWLSTHPSHRNRANQLDRLVPEALELRAGCDCPALPSTDPRAVFSKSVRLLLDSVKVKSKEGVQKEVKEGRKAPALAPQGTQPQLAGVVGATPSLPQALVSK
ncbi:hypothetical protein MATL_G00026550 [Megalops atlanticus]|uniref:Metalloendopeptidase OMA1, mitochondrial n=1 Tax=Megalops atlanticus TaxID=7932 RepID=A0A9D3QD84_MEGAT|nr:hypothetical protein MATL_G00026550 [Megalops atlanticus]